MPLCGLPVRENRHRLHACPAEAVPDCRVTVHPAGLQSTHVRLICFVHQFPNTPPQAQQAVQVVDSTFLGKNFHPTRNAKRSLTH
jgi:hypothetical protein